jgi:bifunctional non-homologous end joining protein LigD
MSPAKKHEELRIGRRTLRVSNLGKVLYPKAGFTKGQVIDYYARIAPVMLPHVRDHPVTLKRYPDGVEAGFFYEKMCPAYRPDWMKIAPRASSGGKRATVEYCLLSDAPSLVWVANLAALELHTMLSRAKSADRPLYMVFDHDPGEGVTLLDCIAIALRFREMLAHLGLQSFPKTSGGKGLHLYVPLNTTVTFDQTKLFSRSLAQLLERDDPQHVTTNMSKALRVGKVFVDWSQNDDHKTTVAVYSLRARERPTVSTPVTWDEVERAHKKKDADSLLFTADQVLQRVEKLGDVFAPVLKLKQKLPLQP